MKLSAYSKILRIITLALLPLLMSCSKDTSIPEEEFVPLADLRITSHGSGSFTLDASASKFAEEIKWEVQDFFNYTTWIGFSSDSEIHIVVPDSAKDYDVNLKVRNGQGESSMWGVLSGSP